MLASFDAGGAATWWSAAGSRWGGSGSLVKGDVDLDDGSDVVRVMAAASDGSLLRLNDGGPLVLRDFFGGSGEGADLTVWVRTSVGTATFPTSGVASAGSNYVNFRVPSSERAVVRGIGAGDRFMLALTRPAPQPVPEVTAPVAADSVTALVLASDAVGELMAQRAAR